MKKPFIIIIIKDIYMFVIMLIKIEYFRNYFLHFLAVMFVCLVWETNHIRDLIAVCVCIGCW